MNLSKFIAPGLAAVAMGCTINSDTESSRPKESPKSSEVSSTQSDVDKKCAELHGLILSNIRQLEMNSQFTVSETDRSFVHLYLGVISGEQHGYEIMCGHDLPPNDMDRVTKAMKAFEGQLSPLRVPDAK